MLEVRYCFKGFIKAFHSILINDPSMGSMNDDISFKFITTHYSVWLK